MGENTSDQRPHRTCACVKLSGKDHRQDLLHNACHCSAEPGIGKRWTAWYITRFLGQIAPRGVVLPYFHAMGKHQRQAGGQGQADGKQMARIWGRPQGGKVESLTASWKGKACPCILGQRWCPETALWSCIDRLTD